MDFKNEGQLILPSNTNSITYTHETRKTEKPIVTSPMSITASEKSSRSKRLSADSLNTIKTGESAFKLFTFDPSKCKGNVEKCVAFWRSIYESELKPVDCSLYKPPAKSESEIKNMVNKEKIKEEVIEKKTIPWSEALKELQRRRMDKAAKVAKPHECKMCAALDTSFKFDDRLCADREAIEELNKWEPGVTKPLRITQGKATKLVEEKSEKAKEETAEAEGTTQVSVSKDITAKVKDKKQKIEETANEIVEEEQMAEKNESERPDLDLMESILGQVLAKMSDEIDTHRDIKQFVSDLYSQAVQQINKKSDEEFERKRDEQASKIPPYSPKGDYLCCCGEADCECNTDDAPKLEEKYVSKTFKKKKSKKAKGGELGTQFPEENGENGKEAEDEGVKRSYCVVCGLKQCVCKYIEDNNVENEGFTCDMVFEGGE